MKRMCSLILVAAFMLSITVIPVAAVGEIISIYENAENTLNVSPLITTSNANVSLDTDSDIMYGGIYNVISTAAYGYVKFTTAEPLSLLPETLGANAYFEVEFDAKTNSENCTIKLSGDSKKICELQLKQNKLFINNKDNTNAFLLPESKKTTQWNRYRLVFHLTDERMNPVYTLCGLFVNGESLGEVSSNFDDVQTSFIRITVGLKKADESVQLDNVFAAVYNSSDETSPLCDRLALINEIKTAQAAVEKQADLLDRDALNLFNADIMSARALYNSASASRAEVETVIATLKSFPQKICDAINSLKIPESNIVITKLLSENFNNDVINAETLNEPNAMIEIAKNINEMPAIGSALKLVGSGTGYSTLTASFEPVSIIGENEKNSFVVTEFDFCGENLGKATANLTVRFAEEGNNLKSFIISNNGSLRIDGSTEILGTFANMNEWNRMKTVIQLTDAQGNSVNKITSIYLNGKQVLSLPVELKLSDSSVYNMLRLSLSKKDAAFALYTDNLRVTKYIGAEESDIPDGYELYKEIDEVYSLDKSGLSAEKRQALETASNVAVQKFNNPYASKKELDKATKALRFVKNDGLTVFAGIQTTDANGIARNYPTAGARVDKVVFEKKHSNAMSGKMNIAVFSPEGILEAISSDSFTMDEKTGFKYISSNFAFNDNIENRTVKILLWDDDLTPVTRPYVFDVNRVDGCTYNTYAARYSLAPQMLTDDDAYIVAKYTVNLMGMELISDNGCYSVVRDDGKTLAFNINSDTYTVDGECRKTVHSPYKYDTELLIPIQMLRDAFGLSYNRDEKNTFNMTYDFRTQQHPEPPEDLIIYNPDLFAASYKINCSNPDAQIDVWYKDSNYSTDNIYSLYPHRAHKPIYNNGAFYGAFGGLSKSRRYDVTIKITDSSGSAIYCDNSAFLTTNFSEPTYEESLYETNGELLLVPTFENIGFYIDNDLAAENCSVFFRKSTTEQWHEALEPFNDTTGKQFRGSIVNLESNTLYEVKAVLKNSDNHILGEKTATVNTWNEMPPIAETLKLSELYTEKTLLLSNLKGNENGWIRLINDTDITIDAGNELTEAVLIDSCEYLIVDGLTVKGGYRYGINVAGSSKNIRIQNCDISGWGRPGILDEENGAYKYDGTSVNYDAAVLLLNSEKTVVERCYIHDSLAKTNPWRSSTWNDLYPTGVHPKGSEGIYYRVKSGVVIRYNDIIGGDEHRFNDAIEGYGNGSRLGGAAKDTDIYGNMLICSEDDSIELDGAQMNARVYKNRIEQSLCGISTTPNSAGPSYIFNNVITNLGATPNNHSGAAFKIGGKLSDGIMGMHYIINNTVDSDSAAITNMNYNNSTEYHAFTRNNILVTRAEKKYALKNDYADVRDSNDYNMIYGLYKTKGSDGMHSIYNQLPRYRSLENGDLRLVDQIGKGENIANFSTISNGAIGAFEGTADEYFMPLRPVEMFADKYRIVLNDNEQSSITVTFGNMENDRKFSIIKNIECEWLEITSDSGINNVAVAENTSITFSLKADMLKCKAASGCTTVLVRLDNGFSIPITVNAVS